MMKTRLELHELLKSKSGYSNVYFQAPSSLSYPCIIYDLADYDHKYANDTKYIDHRRYNVTVIGKNPDNDDVLNNLLSIEYCEFDRRYRTSENLYHDVFNLYW